MTEFWADQRLVWLTDGIHDMMDALYKSVWAGPLLCFALWLSDYELTVVQAKLYKAQDKVAYEGSYEINPYTQRDIARLRRIGVRIIMKPLLVAVLVAAVHEWATANNRPPQIYACVLGGFALLQLVVHLQHFRSWYIFGRIVPAAEGHISYLRQPVLYLSAVQFLSFGVFLAILFAVTKSVFIFGGAMACVFQAAIHYRVALQHGWARKSAPDHP